MPAKYYRYCLLWSVYPWEYNYRNKKGEKKDGKRTIRKSFRETFAKFKTNFDAVGQLYLLHRYECENDHFYWPHILEHSELGHVFHVDYFENLSCSPKFEPQDAQFSGQQTSLHCAVCHEPDSQVSYVYHVSDDKFHNSAFTNSVMWPNVIWPNNIFYPNFEVSS